MFSNFLKTALRVLWRKKSFSFLNIMGLAVGIAASLLLFLVIQNELRFDDYHKNKDHIYRVVSIRSSRSNGEIQLQQSATPGPLPIAIRNDFPQLEKVATIWHLGDAQIYIPGGSMADEKRFKESGGLFWADPEVFDIFDYTWLAGNAVNMKDPNTVVLSESMAKKFFGSASAAMDRTIQMYSFRIPLRVTGVFKDLPAQTDIPIRMAASHITLRNRVPGVFDGSEWQYFIHAQQCFLLVKEDQSISALQAQLNAFAKKYIPDDPLFTRSFLLQPLSDMHLNQDYNTFRGGAIPVKELWSLGLIGLFLLLVACINFINLSTAQSVNRAKEIGVRKVLGGNRSQLIRQFLQETALVVFLSLILGCLLAKAALPFLNDIMHKGLSMTLTVPVLLYLAVTGIFVTLLAGFYPALVLSGFNPISIFKNKVNPKTGGGILLRRGLVVFQFVIAQLLIIGTVVVVQQMYFFRNRPMGFEKEGVIMVNLPSDSSLRVKYPLLQSRMQQLNGVTATSLCMEAPASTFAYNESFYFNNEATRKDFNIVRQFGDTGFYKTFGISLVTGRYPFHNDSTVEVVVNETAVKKLGIRSPEEIIGKTISFNGVHKNPVVGVLKDYNHRSLHDAITPIAVSPEAGTYEWIAIRMEQDKMKSTLEEVRKLFTGIYPTYMYDRAFLDERIGQYYESEAITAQLFKLFSFLAIFISCLGLYGLVSFMAVQKTKEVGIRKVLGASVQSIIYLFSREFTILVVIAFLIAAPVGYFFMQKWLADFYYHINIGWGVFALAIVSSIIIAWITVGYKAIRAASVNPVKSLKTE